MYCIFSRYSHANPGLSSGLFLSERHPVRSGASLSKWNLQRRTKQGEWVWMQALHCRTLLREWLQRAKPVPGGNLHAVWIRCWNYDNQRFGIIVLISLSPSYIFLLIELSCRWPRRPSVWLYWVPCRFLLPKHRHDRPSWLRSRSIFCGGRGRVSSVRDRVRWKFLVFYFVIV